MTKIKRTLIVFYALSAYIILQFVWWTIHLIQLQQDQWMSEHGVEGSMQNEFSQKVWMIIGEGGVFLLLLILGIWTVHSNLRKQAQMIQKERNFMMSITHELKTPIASVSLILETLRREGISDEKKLELIQHGLNNTKRLDVMAENILLATRMEYGTDVFVLDALNMTDFIEGVVERYRADYGDDRVIVKNDDSALMVLADHRGVESVLDNLVDNAMKYSPKQLPVTISLSSTKDAAILKVADLGPGISELEQKRVFDKFYRSGNEDTRKTKGTGLGLYIVRQVLNAHHGTVHIEQDQEKGVCFVVTLPRLINQT